MSDTVEVVSSGSVDRSLKCQECGSPMLYRIDGAGRVTTAFCQRYGCPRWLKEIPCD